MGLSGATESARLAWKGKDDDTRLFSAFAPAGAGWQPQERAGDDRASGDGPGLATVEGLEGFLGRDVLMVWRGPDEDSRLFSSTHGLGGWNGQQAIGDDLRSSDGPALSRVGRQVLWRGGPPMAWSCCGRVSTASSGSRPSHSQAAARAMAR
jgi:hypothetical protein